MRACMAAPRPPTPSGPVFPGWPPFTSGPGATPCLTVLLIGDSLMREAAPYVADYLAGNGRCATVINAAVNGTPGPDWPAPRAPDAVPPSSGYRRVHRQHARVTGCTMGFAALPTCSGASSPACCIVGEQSKGWAD